MAVADERPKLVLLYTWQLYRSASTPAFLSLTAAIFPLHGHVHISEIAAPYTALLAKIKVSESGHTFARTSRSTQPFLPLQGGIKLDFFPPPNHCGARIPAVGEGTAEFGRRILRGVEIIYSIYDLPTLPTGDNFILFTLLLSILPPSATFLSNRTPTFYVSSST
jgi:hypothetical protein